MSRDTRQACRVSGKGQPITLLAILATTLFILPAQAFAADCTPIVASIESIQGIAEIQNATGQQWERVQKGQSLCPGMFLRVTKNSRVALLLSNNTILRLDQGTTIAFPDTGKQASAWLQIRQGIGHFISRITQSFNVTTPFINAAVEGTEFVVDVRQSQAQITVFEGRVLAQNQHGEVRLKPGQSAGAVAGEAPVLRVMARPRDAVQWALHYPSVVDFTPAQWQRFSENEMRALRDSLTAYQSGDTTAALAAIEPIRTEDEGLLNYRAALLLNVGRTTEAEADLARSLSLNPNSDQGLALASIIAITQNDNSRARRLAEQAVNKNPSSASAKLALSYVQQAEFDIDAALKSVQQAVSHEPNNALAWARLAEMYLSTGNHKQALLTARRAVELNPRLSRTQTVLGFAYLSQIKVSKAKSSFDRAIGLDQTDPLPRLGLGLVLIRRGKLEDGRRQIEYAASLDPNNSLIRSYLGKAYYEEKRNSLAASQLGMAKDLDPNDPTPWFYDAIRKQTENRPVEALKDIQKSIKLNDNRAVYRSHLLLDDDIAMRSTSLGRIYTDLGFQQSGLVEGWKSINVDPGNYSAHRFLADTYSVLPRHEVAKVSELLQAQLLQPINLNPVQPELNDVNAAILNGQGPADASFNEFNSFFTRNQLNLQLSGTTGPNNTRSGEVILSGLIDRISYSLGGFDFDTDGFRDNNDQDINIYNAFIQAQLSYNTSLQIEARSKEKEYGDIALLYTGFFEPEKRHIIELDTQRLGFTYAYTPHSHFISSIISAKSSFDAHSRGTDMAGDFDFDILTDTNGYVTELQNILQTKYLNLIVGAGYLENEEKEKVLFQYDFLPPPPFVLTDEITDSTHTNVYIYSYINYLENSTLTLGASYERFDPDFSKSIGIDRNQVNPKFGINWNIFEDTTLRTAVFRTAQRDMLSDQTIEPTQVAGFNQFYSGPKGEEGWLYGIGLDQKFSPTWYGGAEVLERDLKVPTTILFPTTGTIRADWAEHLTRAYLYWAPLSQMTVGIDYLYEWFERDEIAGTEQFAKLKTHRLPIAVQYFHPKGYIARIKFTYLNQEGLFGPAVPPTPSKDEFWVIDTSLGYRLPNRYGLISLEVKNLLDRQFNFQDTDPDNPQILPERYVLLKLALSF